MENPGRNTDQDEALAFLEDAAAAMGAPVECITTHASVVVLGKDRAFKLKRAVRYAYLDFSTPEKRLAACEAELALNRRAAPKLYRGVRLLTREANGHLAFDGHGSLVDAVVEMRRFDQDCLFDAMARTGALTPGLMTDLARRIAGFHDRAAVSLAHGGREGIAAVLDINDRALRGTSLVAAPEAEAFAASFRRALERHGERLELRRRAGKVRRCHGDLILRNICLLDGVPTLFDCLEFDEDLATIDVLYDLAFLLMDLWHRKQRDLANLVLNRYLDARDETDGLPLVPFFMAIRAAVRAHVTAAQADKAADDARVALKAEALAYFDLARALLAPAEPVLLAIGGFSGSGKSTVAAHVAARLGPAPGARILNSDRIRKQMHGLEAEERLPDSAYGPQASEAVYAEVRRQAADILAMGSGVVADAVFHRPAERDAIRAVAAATGVRFHGVWLEAPPDMLRSRIEARRNGPSDATVAVLAAQLRRDCGEVDWQRVDAAGDQDDIRDTILESADSTS